MTKVYNREAKEYYEINHYGEKYLNTIYSHNILTYIFTKKIISSVYGIINQLPISKIKIKKFIKDNHINMELYEKKKYKSFNDFFIRKLKRIDYDKDINSFISPCTSKLLVYKIDNDLKVNIKGINYSMHQLFDTDIVDFKGAYMFIYRLSVDDYHRFHYIDDGKRIIKKEIKGKYHTVSDASKKHHIYQENHRSYSILDTKHFGKIIYMEVGALLIGKIIDHNLDTFRKGEEKGYFLPGASTVIVIAKDIDIDQDILNNSKKGIETIVRCGEKVGQKKSIN